MTEQPHELLKRAADRLEEMAAKTLQGPWTAHDGTKEGFTEGWHFSSDDAWLGVEAVLEAEAEAQWIATLSPVVATPLVAWLRFESRFVRRNAEYMGGTESDLPSVQFARLVLGEDS